MASDLCCALSFWMPSHSGTNTELEFLGKGRDGFIMSRVRRS